MCFGNQQTTNTTTTTPPAWLTNAGSANTGFALNLENSGFTPYSGNQVAGFSPQQQQSFTLGSQIGDSVSPYTSQIGSAISNYMNAGPQSVSPQTISSAMSPYMSQYVQQSLLPQLTAEGQQFAAQDKSFDSAATGAGAFGDSSWNLGRSNLTTNQNIANAGLVGNAYNTAFNTAIGAGAQDVANNLQGQTTNANLAETALGRQLGGATALNNTALGATNLINTLGGQQTAQTQAQLNAAYNQYLMATQYPFQTLGATDQALNAAKGTGPTTQTTQQPNNAGYGLLGAGLGAVGSIFGGPIGGMVGSAVGNMFSGSNPSGGIFGGNTYSGANNVAAGQGYGAGYDANGNWTGYADGGKVKGNKPIVVGERGPEVFVPKKDGVVIPNEIMQAAREKRAAKTGSPDGLSRQLGIAA